MCRLCPLLKIFLIFILLLIVFRKTSVFATEDFYDYYNVSYDVLPNGTVKVVQNISIVNNTLTKYASDYTINVGGGTIQEVRAQDRLGELETRVNRNNGNSEINVTFKDKVVGARRSLDWNLTYLSRGTAKKHGSVWEIILPRVALAPNIKAYNLELNVPLSFGREIFVSPLADEHFVSSGFYHYRFSRETFAETGIMLAFGESQKFRLDLTYHLKNTNFVSSLTEVALPPDIFGEQQLVIDSLTPKPLQVRLDEDGNYLAQYKIGARETLSINFKGKILIFHKAPRLGDSGKIPETPLKLQEEYTRPQKFWESGDREIKKIASGLVDNDLSAAANAKKIYDYVVATLDYGWEEASKGALERQGAKKALSNKKAAVCMEYADLLIALLRAAGLPARRLTGFAYSENNFFQPVIADALHTWVQAYIAKVGWMGIDPTWGSTTKGLDYFSKLDTNHLVFAINGLNSETPYPAGTYKLTPEQRGDIKVSFLEDESYTPPPASLQTVRLPQRLKILNNSSVAALDLLLTVTQKGTRSEFFAGTLPPYAGREFSLDTDSKQPLQVNLFFKDFTGQLKNETRVLHVEEKSKAPESGGSFKEWFLLGLALCTIFFVGRVLLFFRRKRSAPLPDPPRAQDQ